MLKTGLVSISFRHLDVAEIINMVHKAGLDGIEWGSDVHVPHGDINKANEVRMRCDFMNIDCKSYGSYYKVGEYADPVTEFKGVLDSAVTLQSDVIRIWAGTKSTSDADVDYWKLIVEELATICDMASAEGKDIALEYHANTLTDNSTSTIKLIAKTQAVNLSTYWQPPAGLSHEDNLHDIKILKNHISNIHAFSWNGHERMALEEGYTHWEEYFKLVNTWKIRYCMLEFIRDNSIEGFYRDAAVLKELVSDYR